MTTTCSWKWLTLPTMWCYLEAAGMKYCTTQFGDKNRSITLVFTESAKTGMNGGWCQIRLDLPYGHRCRSRTTMQVDRDVIPDVIRVTTHGSGNTNIQGSNTRLNFQNCRSARAKLASASTQKAVTTYTRFQCMRPFNVILVKTAVFVSTAHLFT